MTIDDKKNVFYDLGLFLQQFKSAGCSKNQDVKHNDEYFDLFIDLIQLSQSHNGWYTPENVYYAIESWTQLLTKETINEWLSAYQPVSDPKNIGLILAGNIPLVGFHDFISVILSGHKAIIKTSSNDQKLLPFLVRYMTSVDPRFTNWVAFTDKKLENYDAVIATGSNNTARYFEYYFKNVPSIIRKNRNSVAVLTGDESQEELKLLGEDIFRYFGLGCRNVSKLMVPAGYDFDILFKAIFDFKDVIHYEKYSNNYDYNKAVYLMSNYKLLDNGFLILREDNDNYSSPIASLSYEYYNSLEDVAVKLTRDAEQLQCIVGLENNKNSVSFGQTQKPNLTDYADGIDTMKFLTELG